MKLEIKNLACGYDKRPVLHRVNFTVNTGEICCLLGPNGVGKTTLFKTLLGLISLSHEAKTERQDIKELIQALVEQVLAPV